MMLQKEKYNSIKRQKEYYNQKNKEQFIFKEK